MNDIFILYNLFILRLEVIVNIFVVEVFELLIVSFRNSFFGDVLGWYWNILDVVIRIMLLIVCDILESVGV